MEFNVSKGSIQLTFPAANAGKYRFKKRKSRFDFGETFSTRECCFDENTYLEWQIGYDIPVKDVENGKEKTRLDKDSFIGSNGKRKYPYELSEIFNIAIELNFIEKKHIENLIAEIQHYNNFIDGKAISIERHSKININGVIFEETSIKLPTLFMVESLDQTQIEVSIQKQQYASGVQPMVYFCIPLKSFNNNSKLLGKSSVVGDELTYTINKDNAQNLTNLVKIFGMASKRHNHDIIQILQILHKIKK